MGEMWGLPAQPGVTTACAVAYGVGASTPLPRACPQDGTSFMSQQEVLQDPHQLRHCFWGAGLWGASGVLQATFYYIENRAGEPTLGRLHS